MTPLILALLFVVLGTLAYLALRNAQDFSDANQIIPGVPTRAPKEWAGAHSPEARLHRRLRDAMEAVRVNAALDDTSLVDVRMSLEQEALATDDRLIAAAALPKGRREDLIAQVARMVDSIEGLVADLVELRGPTAADAEQRIEDLRTRVALVSDARDELAGLGSATPDLMALRDRLEADPVEPRPTDTPEDGAHDVEDPEEHPGADPEP